MTKTAWFIGLSEPEKRLIGWKGAPAQTMIHFTSSELNGCKPQ